MENSLILDQKQPKTQRSATWTLRGGVDWSIAGPLLLAHGLALLAPFYVSGAAIVGFGIMYLLTGLGVTLGAHRYFTHQSFRAHPVLDRALMVLFTLAAQGSLLRWVRDHHIHHAYADHEGDPHSPHHEHGFWHAQLLWLWQKPLRKEDNKALYERFAKSLRHNRAARLLAKPLFLIALHLSVLTVLYVIGALLEKGLGWESLFSGYEAGMAMVVWAGFLRIICVLHATNLVNSLGHLYGYRNYESNEQSKNNALVALVSLGEGWHNNHHGKPLAANQGFHKWWEFDLSFLVLLMLGLLGLAKDIRVYRPRLARIDVWFRVKVKTP